jgi:hypothetical protein
MTRRRNTTSSWSKRLWRWLADRQIQAALIGGLFALLAVVLAAGLAARSSSPPTTRPTPASTATSTPPTRTSTATSTPAVIETGCIIEATNDTHQGAGPRQITVNGYVVQPFIATDPFVTRAFVVIGWNPRVTGGPVGRLRFELLDASGRVLATADSLDPMNNSGTDGSFDRPVRVTPGSAYAFKVVNTSGYTVGVYFDLDAPNDRHTTPRVVGELGRPDGPRTGLLTGCVYGAHD